MKVVGNVLSVLTTLMVALLASGFLGRAHPVFDSLAVGRPYLALALVGALALATVLRARGAQARAAAGVFLAFLGLAPTLVPEPPPTRAEIVGYTQNLRFDNPTPDAVVAAIRAANPDFVMLQEVSEANGVILAALADDYPVQAVCAFSGIGGVALLTRLPVVGAPGCARGQGLVWAEVQTADGFVTLASVHLPWPWPYGQRRQIGVLSQILADLPGRIVLAGDFNMVPWSHAVARLATASRTRIVRGLHLTFTRPPFWPGLPIDHVLAPPTMRVGVAQLPPNGSDHAALVMRIGLR